MAHVCGECAVGCTLYGDDWHWCHMSSRCERCDEWVRQGEQTEHGTDKEILCPACSADYRRVQRDTRQAAAHGVPYSYWRAGVDPKDFA